MGRTGPLFETRRLHEPVHRFANWVGVLAFAERAPFHEQSHAAESSDRRRVAAAVAFPMSITLLLPGNVIQAFVDHLAIARWQVVSETKRGTSANPNQ